MYKKYCASRFSRDNILFPPQIILEETGITIKRPELFSDRITSIAYDMISHIHVFTPLIGFSSISFFTFGEEICINGFTKTEANEIKQIITTQQ